MKQVWIINHYAQEPGSPGGTRHHSLAQHLLTRGWQATVIAASTELNTGRQRLASHAKKRLDYFNNVPFLWVRAPGYSGNGRGRVVNMLAFSLRVLLRKTTSGLSKPDVVIGSSVHPFAAWSGALLAKRFGVPFVFEVRDLWPQTLVDMGRLRSTSILTRLFKRLEGWLYRRAEKIIALMPRASEYIEHFGISRDKVIWIPNGVELKSGCQPAPLIESAEFVLMYFGAHGGANALDNLLLAMDQLAREPPPVPVRLRLIGDGPQKPALVKQAREMKLRTVAFEEPVAKEQIPRLASEASAFVFNLIDAPIFKYGISSNKLFDFLAAARPIIFCGASSNNPVEEAGAGLTVRPGDPTALANAIRYLIAMPMEQRNRMGSSGRKYVETRHSFDFLAGRLATLLDQTVRKPNGSNTRERLVEQ